MRRLLVVFLLGFSSGLPLALTGTTLQAWMKAENVDLSVIGLFALVGLPYTLKFIWSPLMDRFVPPLLGRRRGWILLCQVALVVAIAAMAFSKPFEAPALTALLAFAVAFFSASQDIVVDAFRTEMLSASELGPGASLHITGYRIAMLVSGAVALILADHVSWRWVYFTMAAAMAVGVAATLAAPESATNSQRNGLAPTSLHDAVVLPFVEFFKRRGAVEVLFFVILYKLDVVIATAMTTPFMLELGFTKTDIGAVTKGFGLVATLGGTLAGGVLMVKLGMRRSLLFFGIFQAISGLSFAMLARLGHHYPMMVGAIAAENFCGGMGNAAFTAFMMSQCDRRFTATQYALLTSLMALTRVLGSAPSGFLAKGIGWENYFFFSVVASLPGLLLLARFRRWEGKEAQ